MMRGSFAVALATGTLVVVAYGGFAMAVEAEDPGDVVAAITATAEPEAASGEEASGDAPSPDAPADEHGLTCVLVPVETEPTGGGTTEDETTEGETTEGETTEGETTEPTDDEPQTIEQLLAVNTIECSGTGNERSSEVALVPRYLAHSDEFTGSEKGAAIAAWAKTHANKKFGHDKVTDEDEAPTAGDVPTDDDAGDSAPSTGAPASPGKSGDAPGKSGSHPGNGKGR
jgi:hypothetical protein